MKTPITLGNLIDTSFHHYTTFLPELLGISLWLLVAQIPSALGTLLSSEGVDLSWMTIASFSLNALGFIGTVLVSIHVGVALILAISQQRTGVHIDPRAMLREAFAKDLSYTWASILQALAPIGTVLIPLCIALVLGFIASSLPTKGSFVNALGIFSIFGGIIAALVGAIIVSVRYTFTPFTNVIEGKRGLAALRGSRELVEGSWWSVAINTFIPSLLYTILFATVLGILAWISGSFALMFSQNSFLIAKLTSIFNLFIFTLGQSLITPLLLITSFVLYENRRSR